MGLMRDSHVSRGERFLRLAGCSSVWAVCLSLGELNPEEKPDLAIGMADVCIRVCAGAVGEWYPAVSKEGLVEKVRERLMHAGKCRSEA